MIDKSRFIGIIPARYASTRFPGKPLALLCGKPMIQHVWERASQVLDHVIVATDDERIADAVSGFGGVAVMTSPNHRSGTDRCFEAYQKSGNNEDVVINIQGDEPFIHPSQIEALMACFNDETTDIATLIKTFDPERPFEELQNPNKVKVVVDKNMFAKYFSRSVIPYVRGKSVEHWTSSTAYYTHLGMYAYTASALRQITALPPSTLEIAESLEQLRWLENGFTIKTAITNIETIGIDTPQDLEMAEKYINNLK